MKLKLLAVIILFTIIYSLFPSRASAQFQNPNYLNTNPDVPQNLNTYTQSVFINITTALSCIFTGIDPLNVQGKCLGIDPTTRKIGYVEGGGGLMAITGNLIASTFYIPVSTHDYGSYMASNFGIGEKTYAQGIEGIGFSGLRPTLNLWKAFRNITYMIFVVIFLIIGLGIMFRIKIDPRTVMTVQNQIPKIIIALVLVTFSYAIAGFLIDLMYVSIYLIVSVFTEQGIDSVSVTSSNPFGAAGGLGGISGIAGAVADSIAGIVASIFDGTIGKFIGALVGGIIAKSTVGSQSLFGFNLALPATLLGSFLGLSFGNEIVGFIARIIAYLIIIIALFSALLRLWFILIKSYIFILINVVFAPFLIARGLIPGQAGIGGWIRSMVSNLSVFPVTIIMFLLGKAFIDGFSNSAGGAGNTPFTPPMVGDFSSPEVFASIIGLGIILMLPEVANMVRDALKQPEFKYTAAIGKGIGAGVAVSTGIPRETIGTIRAYTTTAAQKLQEKYWAGILGRFFR